MGIFLIVGGIVNLGLGILEVWTIKVVYNKTSSSLDCNNEDYSLSFNSLNLNYVDKINKISNSDYNYSFIGVYCIPIISIIFGAVSFIPRNENKVIKYI